MSSLDDKQRQVSPGRRNSTCKSLRQRRKGPGDQGEDTERRCPEHSEWRSEQENEAGAALGPCWRVCIYSKQVLNLEMLGSFCSGHNGHLFSVAVIYVGSLLGLGR